jgi:L-asparagine transporter-like permease
MKSEAELKKVIGLWGLVSLGVGGIIGSGIFSMPAVMGSVSGPSFIIAVVLIGLILLLLALIYAELGASNLLTDRQYSIPRVAWRLDLRENGVEFTPVWLQEITGGYGGAH